MRSSRGTDYKDMNILFISVICSQLNYYDLIVAMHCNNALLSEKVREKKPSNQEVFFFKIDPE